MPKHQNHLDNISARIVADSVNPISKRLTSFVLKYPRFIHAELMTHRVFSRNAASSRAIPVRKMIEAVEDYPASFVFWGSNQPGMKAKEQISDTKQNICRSIIHDLKEYAINAVRQLEDHGLHKQNSNRYLEPFGHITVLVTSCDWENFFALRVHPDAQPEFQELATKMAQAWLDSEPNHLRWGDWHAPQFGGTDWEPFIELGNPDEETMLKVATARCARLSYLTFDGEHSPEKDIQLHDSLAAAGHWSPFEHCAQAHCGDQYPWSNFDQPEIDGLSPSMDGWEITGLSHWKQYRKNFPEERKTISKEELRQRIANRPAWIHL